MKSVQDRILVVAAHPDDEVIGCGGTIARHVAEGAEVSVLIIAEGSTSRQDQRDRQRDELSLSELAEAAHQANRCLGVHRLNLLDFPDNRMDGVERLDVIKAIEREIKQWQPQTVYTHHSGDVNIDHRVIHDAVIAATRPQPGVGVHSLLFFEVASSTEWRPSASGMTFQPDWFVGISDYWQLKNKALEAYSSEMREFPHPRSSQALEHLACWRGASVGLPMAEAFMLGRKVLT